MLDTIPNEIILLIFSLVDICYFRKLAGCCKRYDNLLKNEQIWQSICKKEYSESYLANFDNINIHLIKRLKYYNNIRYFNRIKDSAEILIIKKQMVFTDIKNTTSKSIIDYIISKNIDSINFNRENKIISTNPNPFVHHFILFDKPLSTKFSLKFQVLNTENPISLGFINNIQNLCIGKRLGFEGSFLSFYGDKLHLFTHTRINSELYKYIIPDLVTGTIVEFSITENYLIINVNHEEFKIQINRIIDGIKFLNVTNMFPYLYMNISEIQIL